MDEETIKYLIRNYKWDSTQIKLGIRAKCKCEYCDKDLFESADNYMTWEKDHIIPKSSKLENFDYETFDNLAIACKQCNYNFKHKYNPAIEIGYNKSRDEYISTVRDYVKIKREQKDVDLEDAREIFKKYIK